MARTLEATRSGALETALHAISPTYRASRSEVRPYQNNSGGETLRCQAPPGVFNEGYSLPGFPPRRQRVRPPAGLELLPQPEALGLP